MQVRFLTATDYEPTPEDSFRCWGQLRLRASVLKTDKEQLDGTFASQGICGPMVRYFPVGAKPDLIESVALSFIASGAAEAFDGPEVKIVDTAEIVKDIAVTP